MRWIAQSGFSLVAMALGFTVIPLNPDALRADNPTGHVLANRFATDAANAKPPTKTHAKSDTDKSRRAADRRRADEQEMLARARSEAEERRAEQERERVLAEQEAYPPAVASTPHVDQRDIDRRVAADRARETEVAEARRRAELEAERRQVEAHTENARRADEVAQRQRHDAEIAARAAEQLRQQESARIAAEAVHREAQIAERRRREEQVRLEQEQEQEQQQQQQRNATLIAEREAEGRRIAEKLRHAEAARAEREARRVTINREHVSSGQPYDPAFDNPREPTRHGPPAPSMAESDLSKGSPTRVTVLLLMEPGNRGIRRRHKTADPVLCSGESCWISSGTDQPAQLLPHRKALGFGRTWGGARAGACSNALGCVFRNVELGGLPGWLQPVDMRLVRHDRREPQRIEGASQCRVQAGALQCRTGHHGSDYVMWVIPEQVAAHAGPDLLEKALSEGLPEPRHVSLAPTLSRR